MTTTQSPTEQARAILEQAREDVKAVLADTHSTVLIGIETRLTRDINQLAFLSGSTVASLDPKTLAEKFPPVTEFFGEKVERPKEITAEVLSPKEAEKAAFLQKVNDFQANIHSLENEQILENYVTKEDQNAIRGVAKRAGLDDYKSAAIDGKYLDLIRTALTEQSEAAAKKAETNAGLGK